MLKSGLNLQRALYIIKTQMRDNKHRRLIKNIIEELRAGRTLADSLKTSGVFPAEYISITAAGEESGKLAEVFASLAEHYKNQAELKKGIKKAAVYPLIVSTAVIISALFLFKFIMPVFVSLFNDFSGELPFLTRLFIRLNNIVNQYFFLILLMLSILFFIIFLIFINDRQNSLIEKIIFKIPVFGRLYKYSILTRIGSYLALLLKSGLKLINALSLLEKMISSQKYRGFINKTAVNISKGASLAECFADDEYIPDLFYYLLLTGEETAQMENMLERAGDYYYHELKEESELLLQYLEPFLITLTAIFVALLAAGVMLPLFQIYLII
jgi:type II secretory pathway component PulF